MESDGADRRAASASRGGKLAGLVILGNRFLVRGKVADEPGALFDLCLVRSREHVVEPRGVIRSRLRVQSDMLDESDKRAGRQKLPAGCNAGDSEQELPQLRFAQERIVRADQHAVRDKAIERILAVGVECSFRRVRNDLGDAGILLEIQEGRGGKPLKISGRERGCHPFPVHHEKRPEYAAAHLLLQRDRRIERPADLHGTLTRFHEDRTGCASRICAVDRDIRVIGIGREGEIGPSMPQAGEEEKEVDEQKEDDTVEHAEIRARPHTEYGLQVDGRVRNGCSCLLPVVFRHAASIGRAQSLVNVSRCVLSSCRRIYDGKHGRYVV